MHDIKFKYYCKDMTGKVFSFITTIRDLEQAKLNINTYGRIQEIIARCQQTGKKDDSEQANELFGDDICKANWHCDITFDNEPHELIGTIEWDETDLIWMFDYGHGSVPLANENLTDIERVGSIHENPELLK